MLENHVLDSRVAYIAQYVKFLSPKYIRFHLGVHGAVVAQHVLSPWGSWSTCSCAGTKTRSRTIVEKQEGAECLSLKEEVGCKDKNCKVDCQMSGWETWSKCSTFCGAGTQSRIRSVDTAPSGGGKACPAAKETQDCMPPCSCENLFCEAECEVETKLPNAEVVGEGWVESVFL
ncbi:spondin-1-like [Ciona intestinalis]